MMDASGLKFPAWCSHPPLATSPGAVPPSRPSSAMRPDQATRPLLVAWPVLAALRPLGLATAAARVARALAALNARLRLHGERRRRVGER